MQADLWLPKDVAVAREAGDPPQPQNSHADAPNPKWVTDISYIHTDEGIIYLSMIRDIYDNSIVAYKTAVQQTVNLVLDTIRLAMKDEKKRATAELQLHSGQGFQYTSQGYFNLTKNTVLLLPC